MSSSSPAPARVVLVADRSESARPAWQAVRNTISEILRIAPPEAVSSIYLLGTGQSWSPSEWAYGAPAALHLENCGSFVAPVCQAVHARGDSCAAIIIVGSGQVFDLGDWVDFATDWVLLRVGDASLQPPGLRMREYGVDALETVREIIADAHLGSRTAAPGCGLSGPIEQRWLLDRTGYPMVYVRPLDRYVHLFPNTKPQFEAFLAEARIPDRGDVWYEQVLELNPRLSPALVSMGTIERLLITGLLPADVAMFKDWYGLDYDIPTVSEWQEAHDWLASQAISVPPAALEAQMARPARQLWHGLLQTLAPGSLLDLSLMSQGVIEWVRQGEDSFAGMGTPRQRFYAGFHTNPFHPTSVTRRSRLWGCRLVRL